VTYIDPRGKVFAHLDRLAGWRRGVKPAPVTVEWDLSNRCVLGCQDCHFAHTHIRGPWATKPRILPMAYDSTGDLADVGLVRRGLVELAAAGVQSIVWSGGGEPTTHPELAAIVARAHQAGLEQGMYTLGGLIDRPLAAALKPLAWVVVSLDACDPETYAVEKGVPSSRFDLAIHGIRALVEDGPPVVGVSFLLHGENVHRAWDMLAMARRLGATYTTFRPAIRTSPDRPSACADRRDWIDLDLCDALADEPDVEIDPQRFRNYADWAGHGYGECFGPRLHTTITPDGRVWLCPQRRGVTPLGDLRIEGFESIWSRHPGRYAIDDGCRVMCRLHAINQQLAAIETPCAHEAFL
jgi:MoaA/NifB/PqqE/SkfB family radical SAM enzyme